MNNTVINLAVEGSKLITGAMAYRSTSRIGSEMARTFLKTAPRIFKTRKQAEFAIETFGMGLGCAASIAANEAIDEAVDGVKTIAGLTKSLNKTKKNHKHNAKNEKNKEKGNKTKDSTEKKD